MLSCFTLYRYLGIFILENQLENCRQRDKPLSYSKHWLSVNVKNSTLQVTEFLLHTLNHMMY